MKFFSALFFLGTCAWAAEPVATPGAQIHIRSSIGENHIKGNENAIPGMAAVQKARAIVGITKEEMRDLFEKYPSDELRKLIAGASPEYTPDVDAYYLDTYEVTNLQYLTYLKATGRKPSAKLIEYRWPNGEIPKGQENYPIAAISKLEAEACARWMGKRLPTEFEWEMAARGPEPESKANRYAWGKAWDHTKCANARSARGNTVAVDQYKDDVSPFGIIGLMGNVSEWTDSTYGAYPGFKPPETVDPVSKKQVTVRPGFNPQFYVVRGGNAEGDAIICSAWWRNGFTAADRWSLVGFRCARSNVPGDDALDFAAQDLASLVSEVNKNPLNMKDVCAQEILQLDAAQNNLITASKTLAFGHVDTFRGAWVKLQAEAIDSPLLIGVLSTTERMEYPKLPPGSYAILYKPAGTPKKKDVAKTAEDKKENGKDKAKDEPKKDNEKDKPKAGAPRTTPKDAPRDKEAAAKAKEAEAKAAAEEAAEEAAAQSALSKIGAIATLEDVAYPLDKDVYLFKAPNGKVVAFLEAERIGEVKRVKASFTYDRASTSEVPKAIMMTGMAPANATIHPSADEIDAASFEFNVALQNPQGNCPRFKLKVYFKANTFEREDGK
ncbi:MAG: formylglycine-generating enzyme family protein [Planctomycetota bacterium]